MNGKPHVHKLVINERHQGGYRLNYGDSGCTVKPLFHGVGPRDIEVAAAALIRRHDRESARAQMRADVAASLKQPLFDGVHWPSETPADYVPPPPPAPDPAVLFRGVRIEESAIANEYLEAVSKALARYAP